MLKTRPTVEDLNVLLEREQFDVLVRQLQARVDERGARQNQDESLKRAASQFVMLVAEDLMCEYWKYVLKEAYGCSDGDLRGVISRMPDNVLGQFVTSVKASVNILEKEGFECWSRIGASVISEKSKVKLLIERLISKRTDK